ncbi:MAG: hypothetical protein PHT20_07035 [Rhodoferax sp.]|nr:hypothetical protein [Rhodoferax sp.]MDD2808637.1 hypothetical protein [Rhodoferax sp.]MDD4943519.1 hypothetical protein [Rhodoferax sp.]MDD5479438.1 hypothetical protein [Rhodoferax sp.]
MNAIQRLKTLGMLPMVLKFSLVHQTPFFDDGGDLARQITFDHFASCNFDQAISFFD